MGCTPKLTYHTQHCSHVHAPSYGLHTQAHIPHSALLARACPRTAALGLDTGPILPPPHLRLPTSHSVVWTLC
jgi:hypothetical protein